MGLYCNTVTKDIMASQEADTFQIGDVTVYPSI